MGKYLALIALCLGLSACGEAEKSSKSSMGSDYGAAPAVARVSSQNVPPEWRGVLAKQLFGPKATPSKQAPEPFGGYSDGCLAGAIPLAETGPTWQAMRLSRNRYWGHPDLIDFVQELSRKAEQQPGWAGLYVGDMSQPRGGQMSSGHASHQLGLDVDIWMLPPKRLNLSAAERESLSSISTRRSAGAYTNDNWTRGHHEVIKAAAQDPRVARIFVFPGAKVRMCNEEKGDRGYLRKIRPWYGHHYHFHVRLNCPKGARYCENQDQPPAGDGCEDAQTWVNNILNPPPPDPNAPKPKPKPPLTLERLPAQCVSVLQSP